MRLIISLRAIAGGSALALAVVSQPIWATTLYPETFTCPIGGEVFEDYVVGSSTSWGQRPDGMPYGTLPNYPVTECPGNGFILFDAAFTPEEIATLTPLVENDAYQAMRRSETAHYRSWWLMRATEHDATRLADQLLQASWETDDDLVRKRRYQQAYIDAVAAIEPTDEGWFFYTLRAVNALRELSQFELASDLLEQLAASSSWPVESDEREGARFIVDGLRALIADRNPYFEPTNLIPREMADERCLTMGGELSPTEREACDALPERRYAEADDAISAESAVWAAEGANAAVDAAVAGAIEEAAVAGAIEEEATAEGWISEEKPAD